MEQSLLYCIKISKHTHPLSKKNIPDMSIMQPTSILSSKDSLHISLVIEWVKSTCQDQNHNTQHYKISRATKKFYI